MWGGGVLAHRYRDSVSGVGDVRNLRRGIGVGVKGVHRKGRNSCAVVAPRNPDKQGELLDNQLFSELLRRLL